MNGIVIRKFGCTIDELKEAAKYIDAGFDDEQLGPDVLARMPGTFRTDYAANLTALVNAITAQSIACGRITELAGDLQDKLGACGRRARTARDLAKRRFSEEQPLLHSQFAVGERTPQGVESVITRADKVHAACVVHADVLEAAGWPASETTALASAIADVNTTKAALKVAKETKKGATAELIRLANAMYALCREVQIVADAVYPDADAQTDSRIREGRGRFLLGEFPGYGSTPDTAPTDPTAPGSTTPTTPPPATT